MKGLLIKDVKMCWAYTRNMLLLVILFTGIGIADSGNAFFGMYPVFMASLIPSSLVMYDDREKWEVYAGGLPLDAKRMVSVKYILAIIFSAAGTAIAMGARVASARMAGESVNLEFIPVLFAMGLFSSTIILPLLFWLGSEKGRMAYFVAIMAGVAFPLSQTKDIPAITSYSRLISAAVIATAVLFVLSWLISVKLYDKRER